MIKITRLLQDIFCKLSEEPFAHAEELHIYQDKNTTLQHVRCYLSYDQSMMTLTAVKDREQYQN